MSDQIPVAFQDIFTTEEYSSEDTYISEYFENHDVDFSTMIKIDEDNNKSYLELEDITDNSTSNSISQSYFYKVSNDFQESSQNFENTEQKNKIANDPPPDIKNPKYITLMNQSFFQCGSGIHYVRNDQTSFLNFPRQVAPRRGKKNYGNGPEVRNMKIKYPHYKEPYDKCKIYIGFKMPSISFLKELGKDYNISFSQSIKNKIMPKFKRDHTRNYGLAIWFFEDIIHIIEPWLISAKNFNK